MNINITSRKFKAKDSLKDYIEEEIKALHKFNDDILEANVILSYTHNKDSIKTAEIIMQVPGKVLSAANTSDEFSKAVSGALEKITRQLKKIKSKKIAKTR